MQRSSLIRLPVTATEAVALCRRVTIAIFSFQLFHFPAFFVAVAFSSLMMDVATLVRASLDESSSPLFATTNLVTMSSSTSSTTFAARPSCLLIAGTMAPLYQVPAPFRGEPSSLAAAP